MTFQEQGSPPGLDSKDSASNSDKTADQIMIQSIEFSEEIEKAILRREDQIREERARIGEFEAEMNVKEQEKLDCAQRFHVLPQQRFGSAPAEEAESYANAIEQINDEMRYIRSQIEEAENNINK